MMDLLSPSSLVYPFYPTLTTSYCRNGNDNDIRLAKSCQSSFGLPHIIKLQTLTNLVSSCRLFRALYPALFLLLRTLPFGSTN